MKIRGIFILVLLVVVPFITAYDSYIVQIEESKIDTLHNFQTEVISNNGLAKSELRLEKERLVVVSNISEKELSLNKNIIQFEPNYIFNASGEWNYDIIGINSSNIERNTGQGVKIAVLDTGINFGVISAHSGYDFVNEDSDASDDNGHGTTVSYFLKNPIDDFPLEGVEIYSVKVLDEKGEGYEDDIIKGINWAIENDMDMIIMSLGGDDDSIFLRYAIMNAYGNDIFIIAAAGNNGSIQYPARYDEVVSVGAINEDLFRASFSSYGPELDFVGPGENVPLIYGGKYYNVSGTSYGVPHVAIIATSYLYKNKSLNNANLFQKLKENSLDLGSAGRDDEYGWGIPVFKDYDYDGVMDIYDNCPHNYNPNQENKDNDSFGDICDSDKDNDGYNSSIDCDDSNALINPGVFESCNNMDDNCDSVIDEGYDKGVCYVGIGECKVNGTKVCSLNGTVCNAVPKNPNIESCYDELDNDCDGLIDEDCENLFVYSPNKAVYNITNILLSLKSTYNFSKIEYSDNGKLMGLCLNCSSYSRFKVFKEGNHTLIFRGILNGSVITNQTAFVVDSRKPQISTTKPMSMKYTNGSDFYVRYTESNCKNMTLIINDAEALIPCLSGTNIEKTFYYNLSKYNNQIISYKFKIIDIVNSSSESKVTKVKVDTLSPEIKNLAYPVSGISKTSKFVSFNMTIMNEDKYSFNSVKYMDRYDLKPQWKSLCTSLKNNVCYKKMSLKAGNHDIIIRVTDDAGNSDEEMISVKI